MKIINWLGAIGLLLVGLFFATSKRSALQKADRLQEKRVAVLQSNKDGRIRRAEELGDKVKEQMDVAQAAGEKMDKRIKTLEARKETSLAGRVKDFNKTL